LNQFLDTYAEEFDINIHRVNTTTIVEEEDPKSMRKCRLHLRNDAYLFCAQCCEVICESCMKTIHSEHGEKGLIFDYLEFTNLARSRVHTYKEKFVKYIKDTDVPKKEIYDQTLKKNADYLEQLYTHQKIKIEEQFSYLIEKIQELRKIELENFSFNKVFFQNLFEKFKENYTNMQNDIEEGIILIKYHSHDLNYRQRKIISKVPRF